MGDSLFHDRRSFAGCRRGCRADVLTNTIAWNRRRPQRLAPLLRRRRDVAFKINGRRRTLAEIRGEDAPPMPLAEDDDMVQGLAPEGSDHSVRIRILPAAGRTRDHLAGLGRRVPWSSHPSRDGPLGDLDAQFAQLAVDSRHAPEGIGGRHPAQEGANGCINTHQSAGRLRASVPSATPSGGGSIRDAIAPRCPAAPARAPHQSRHIFANTIQNSRSRQPRCGRRPLRRKAFSCCRSARFSTNS
jgi:hypothetical protein